MFFLVKRIEYGFLSECKSVTSELSKEDDVVDRRKRMFLGFSTRRGALLARARADRAFLGLLVKNQNWSHVQLSRRTLLVTSLLQNRFHHTTNRTVK